MNGSLLFLRIFKHGAKNFIRHSWLSLASTLITTLTLLMLVIVMILYGVVSSSLDNIRSKVDVSVYFKLDVVENKVLAIKDQLERLPQVAEVEYISAQKSLDNFKDRYKNDPELLESIVELEGNPLPATFHVKAKKIEDYPQIVSDIGALSIDKYIEKVNYEDNRNAIDRLAKILHIITLVGVTVTVVFVLVSVLVIFNTIALTITNRSFEVEIMRLVGATNIYIRGPFVVESLMQALAATIVASVLMVPVYAKFLPEVLPYFSAASYTDLSSVLIFPTHNFFLLSLFMFVVSFVLSGLTTLFAMRKYLNR